MKNRIYIFSLWLSLLFLLSGLSAQPWIFQDEFILADSVIEDQDHFGDAVALTDSFLLIGAPFHAFDSLGENRLLSSGAAYMFKRKSDGSSELIQKLVAPDRKAVGVFGDEVAMQGEWAMVSSYFAPVDTVAGVTNVGIVVIYHLSQSGMWEYYSTLLAPSPAALGQFGVALALSGNYLLVGADREKRDENDANEISDAGAAYLFEYQAATGWTFKQKLVASDRLQDGYFGQAVDLDGDRAVIGSPIYDVPDGPFDRYQAGQAYVFERNPNSDIWEEVAILTDQTLDFYGHFGRYLAIAGDYLMVGKPREGHLFIGESVINAGAVEVYHRKNSGQWDFQQELIASNYNRDSQFGHVTMQGGIALIGAVQEDFAIGNQDSLDKPGAVYTFELQANGNWQQIHKFTAPNRAQYDGFGYTIALNGREAAVGVPYAQHDSILYDAGITYLFRRDWALEVQAELAETTLQIGPNPTSGLLFVQSEAERIEGIRIWDVQGKYYFLPPSNQSANALALDLHSLTPGMYFLQTILQNGQQHIRKIQKY